PHIFQRESFPHGGTDNGMHRSGRFWSDGDRATLYRQSKSRELRDRGDARALQELAVTQKMLNTGYDLLNAGYAIDTFEQYVAARKRHVGRIASLRGLRQKFETRFGGYEPFVRELRANNHKVLGVEPVGVMDVYDVEVDCPTADDKSPDSGHNFVICPNRKRTGAAIVG